MTGTIPVVRALRATTAICVGALLAVLAVAGARGAAGDDVLVIGDSLGVGMEPYLAPALPGYAIRTDAVVGRGSAAGVEALESNLRPDDEIVVFALGSNDDPRRPQGLAASLERANALAGGRCLVVATLEVSGYSGVDEEPLNEVIRAFAAAHANVRVVDWASAAREDPSLLADGGHATGAGYELRASMFADAIASCDGGASPSANRGPKRDRDRRPQAREREPRDEEPRQRRLSEDEALDVLADSIARQIAIGSLG